MMGTIMTRCLKLGKRTTTTTTTTTTQQKIKNHALGANDAVVSEDGTNGWDCVLVLIPPVVANKKKAAAHNGSPKLVSVASISVVSGAVVRKKNALRHEKDFQVVYLAGVANAKR
jgi:hypothetical protein